MNNRRARPSNRTEAKNMSTMRYSGEIRIRVTYLEPWGAGTTRARRLSNGEYCCRLNVIGGSDATYYVTASMTPPTHPKAFDEAARSALAFAADDGWPVEAHAATNDAGWHIGRSVKTAFPKEKV
jgi:hypothetical protein